jgi:hypothetical protein
MSDAMAPAGLHAEVSNERREGATS